MGRMARVHRGGGLCSSKVHQGGLVDSTQWDSSAAGLSHTEVTFRGSLVSLGGSLL